MIDSLIDSHLHEADGRALEWGRGSWKVSKVLLFLTFFGMSSLGLFHVFFFFFLRSSVDKIDVLGGGTRADLRIVRVTKRAEKIAYYDLVRVSAKICLILSSFGLVQGISWWIEDIGQSSIRNGCLAPFVIAISVEKSFSPII